MKFSLSTLACCFALLASPFVMNAHGAGDDAAITKDQVVALVKKTASDLAADALGTLAKINNGDAPYKDAKNTELYAMVYDTDVVLCGHPKADLQGKSMKGKPDVQGKKFRDEIVASAVEKQTAWVDYVYQKPGIPGIFEKTTYCEAVKGSDGKTYIVCSGMYKPKA